MKYILYVQSVILFLRPAPKVNLARWDLKNPELFTFINTNKI